MIPCRIGRLTVTDPISDSGAAAATVEIAGAGTVVFAAADDYSGGTTILSGTLELAAPGAAGTGVITFAPQAGATLVIDGTPPANPIAGFGYGDTIDLAGASTYAMLGILQPGNTLATWLSGAISA